MAKVIVWNKTARKQFYAIVEYLETERSIQVAENFVKILDTKLRVLSRQPGIGRKAVKAKTVRYINLTKKYRLFYRVKGNQLIVVKFFGTRQSPDKSPF
jgi:plasmid stabilization system protein ParE